MKISYRMENHQPVFLRPLREVLEEEPRVIFLGEVVYEEGSVCRFDGWGVLDGRHDKASLISWPDGDYTYVDMLNLDRTMARALQPGEKLILVYEA